MSLDQVFGQRSSGFGPSFAKFGTPFNGDPVGTTYRGTVARELTEDDRWQMTDYNTKEPLFWDDAKTKPKMQVVIPLYVEESESHPEGKAAWYVPESGRIRNELVRAMAEAGVKNSPPQAGAVIEVTLAERRIDAKNKSGNPANIPAIRYTPPSGNDSATAPVVEEKPVVAAVPDTATDALSHLPAEQQAQIKEMLAKAQGAA